MLAIVGESASGKTVTARTILGLLPETATARDAARVFQEPSTALDPVYPMRWQIAEGLRADGRYARAEAPCQGDRRAPTRGG